MIVAAIPQPLRQMPIFRLALEIAMSKGILPSSVAAEANKILAEAKDLAAQRTNISGDTLKESISLAIRLRTDSYLKDQMKDIDDITIINPENAYSIFNSIENGLAQTS